MNSNTKQSNSPTFRSYSKLVLKSTGQLETLLKVVLAPDVSASRLDLDTLTYLPCTLPLFVRTLPKASFKITACLSETSHSATFRRQALLISLAYRLLTFGLTLQVLDLKGTPRGNQQKLLDIFLSVTATQEDLQDTSFLTQLDMEPEHKTGQAERSLLAPGLGLKTGVTTPQRTETPTPFTDFKRLVSFAMRGET